MNLLHGNFLTARTTMCSTKQKSQNEDKDIEFEMLDYFFMPKEVKNKKILKLYHRIKILDFFAMFFSLSGLFLMILEVLQNITKNKKFKLLLMGRTIFTVIR